ncbi:MAG TPA: alpha/beta hydrolase [Gemmatimonadaceae bacterium]|nr:alpha/beta hydrolase [Gemmatimonadaceae bacterium]
MRIVDHPVESQGTEPERSPRTLNRRTILKAAGAVSAAPLVSALSQTPFVSQGGRPPNLNCEPPRIPLEPTTQKFIDSLAGAKPLYTMTPAAAHAVLTDLQKKPLPPGVTLRPADIKDVVWPVGPTGSTRIRIYRPQDATGVLPVVMYFHGGGWVLGDKITHDRLVRELTDGVKAAFVFVDYINSPEAKYPRQNEQAYASMKYVVEHARELMVDATRLAIAGDSVGGNMCAAITLMAKERSGPRIAYQVLFYPLTDFQSNDSSYQRYANGPWLTAANLKWMFELQGLNGTEGITAFPLRATVEQLRGLPDALVITDDDVLQDEGEEYAGKLSQAGVRVTTVRYNQTIHDFVMLNPLANTPAARGAIAQGIWALRGALHT